MIPLILWMVATGQTPIVMQADDAAAELCRSVMARKMGLNIGSIAISSTKHANGSTVIQGSFSGYRPPARPAPGMAAPLHVINERFDYRCWLRRGSVHRLWTRKVGE